MAVVAAVDKPKPTLQRWLEGLASTLELHTGRHKLELVFEDGRLCELTVLSAMKPQELERWNSEADWLVKLARAF